MSSLTSVRPTYQTIETTPIQIVGRAGRQEAGWMRREVLRDRAVRRHRERRARGRQDRRLRRRRRRRQHGDDQQLVPGRAEDVGAERAEHVVRVVDQELRPVEGLGRDRDDHVDPDQDDRGDDRRDPRRPGRVLGLLVHGDGAVPAPVDEHGDEHAETSALDVPIVERVQPAASDGCTESPAESPRRP